MLVCLLFSVDAHAYVSMCMQMPVHARYRLCALQIRVLVCVLFAH